LTLFSLFLGTTNIFEHNNIASLLEKQYTFTHNKIEFAY
jgi:hypothetical protein